MSTSRILVIGGSGFLGRYVVTKLAAQGLNVIVPTRRRNNARHLFMLPTVDVVEADVHDRSVLQNLVARSDAVINLVGILHSRRGEPYGPDFAKAHVDLPHAIAAAMKATGVRRLVHVSALGASSQAPSMYLRSKADGEALLRAESDIALTVLQPSVIFGPEDQFLNLFARIAAWLPIFPLGSAHAQFQPIFVGDVARAVVHALSTRATFQRTYPLGGPKIYTLRELVQLSCRASGHPRWVINLPNFLARWQAWFFECLPGQPLMSRDNLDAMKVANITPPGWVPPPELGITPLTPLDEVAPAYLALRSPRSVYHRFRARAGR